MKLIILGAGHGVPEVDRHCSGALLVTGGSTYMIDCGAPVSDLMIRRGIPLTALRAVFLTHRHADHTFGLARLLDLCNWHYLTADFDVYMTEQSGVDAMRAMICSATDTMHEDRLRLHTFGPGLVYEDENITVTSVPTNHMNGKHPSYAFVIDAKSGEDQGKRIVFTGDLHHGDAADFPAPAKTEPSDAIVSELVHFGIPAAIEQWKNCPTKRLFITHYSNRFPLDPKAAAELEAALSGLPFPSGLVHDGDEYEI